MIKLDRNNDGVVDINEFLDSLGKDREFDIKIAQRTNDKLAELKEMMLIYMGTHGDAYKKFD